MAHSEVLLLKPVTNLGGEGEKVSVKSGYARNYLIPRKLAIPATRSTERQIESLRVRRAEREAAELEEAQAVMSKLEGLRVAIVVKTGEGGKMFGAVTAQDLVAKIAENGIELDRRQVHLPAPVKSIGDHSVTIKLHPQVQGELRFEIVSENPIED
ncbi:MAG: 50S ribosomal protein L9 [Verrucomicrobiota bacterium]